MQTSYSSSRILLPVRPWFIGFSLLLALLLNFLPTAAWPGLPDWLALVIVFWSVREPRRVGMGLAFLFGVAMDVADASLLGQHALAYVLAAYWRLVAVATDPLVSARAAGAAGISAAAAGSVGAVQRAYRGRQRFSRPRYFLGPCMATLLWPVLTFVLLLPQHQPVDHDANRPL
jgi:rod shape-determining protein MreD